MDNCLLFTYHTFRERSLCLHPNLARKLGVHQKTEIQICFGSRKLLAEVDLYEELSENEASLSSDIMNLLKIPDNCHFDIKLSGNEIHIGPFIGLIAGYSNKSVRNKLDDLFDYVLHYRDINVMIIAFSLENIDKENLTVEGYVFNPLKKRWENGIFPYPSSIFVMTSSVSSRWIKHFKSIIGDYVFNDFCFNKLEIQRILSASVEVKDYLPEAILYRSPRELYNFLIKYPHAIVKSKSAYGDSLLYNLAREMKNYIVLSSLSRGVIKETHNNKKDQLFSMFDRYFKKGEVIIQESVDHKYNRKISFRLIMVKNENDHWENMGMYAKQKVSITETKNIYPLIKLEKNHLIEYFQFSDLISSMLIQEIFYIAHDAIKVLERNGAHIADLAFDMTIDDNTNT
jgi:hypothetical protein